MEGLVQEYVNFLNDDTKHASETFLELEKRIRGDKRHPGVIMEPNLPKKLYTCHIERVLKPA